MFEASVDGQTYDPDRWSQYYKPAGFQGGNGSTGDEAATPKAAPAPVVNEDVPFEPDAPAEAAAPVQAPAAAAGQSSQRAEDILAMIRNRQKAS